MPICLNTFDLLLGKLRFGGERYRISLLGVFFKVKSERELIKSKKQRLTPSEAEKEWLKEILKEEKDSCSGKCTACRK